MLKKPNKFKRRFLLLFKTDHSQHPPPSPVLHYIHESPRSSSVSFLHVSSALIHLHNLYSFHLLPALPSLNTKLAGLLLSTSRFLTHMCAQLFLLWNPEVTTDTKWMKPHREPDPRCDLLVSFFWFMKLSLCFPVQARLKLDKQHFQKSLIWACNKTGVVWHKYTYKYIKSHTNFGVLWIS